MREGRREGVREGVREGQKGGKEGQSEGGREQEWRVGRGKKVYTCRKEERWEGGREVECNGGVNRGKKKGKEIEEKKV